MGERGLVDDDGIFGVKWEKGGKGKGRYQAVEVVIGVDEVDSSRWVPGEGLCGWETHAGGDGVGDGDLAGVEADVVPEFLYTSQVGGGIFCGVMVGLGDVVCEICLLMY